MCNEHGITTSVPFVHLKQQWSSFFVSEEDMQVKK